MKELEIKRHLGQIMHFLSFRSRSEKELYDYLADKGIEDTDRETIIERVRELGLINDDDFCRQLIEAKRKRWYGPKKIYFDLLNKGIASSTAKAALAAIDQKVWQETIISYCQKKSITAEICVDRANKTKLVASLYSRGFEGNLVSKAIDSLGTSE